MPIVRPYSLAFPGQATLHKHLLAPFAVQKHLFQRQLDQIDHSLNERFSSKLLQLPSDHWLMDTANAQPAILATSIILLQLAGQKRLQRGEPDLLTNSKYVLGHSLGEYTALTAAGVFDLPTAVAVVRKRGQLLNELCSSTDYGMTALLLGRRCEFDSLISAANTSGVLATVNSRSQVVISGSKAELSKFVESQGKSQIVKAVPLAARIPFHNKLLREIEPQLHEYILSKPLGEQNIPVISNVTGLPSSDRDQSITNTVQCNHLPVQWKRSLDYLEGEKVSVVGVGPGRVLEPFMKGTKISFTSLEDME